MVLSNKKRIWYNKVHTYSQFLFAVAFYLLFVILDGPKICPDSEGYITMSVQREPLYPLFLWLFRLLFQHTALDYLFAATVAQGVIAAYAAWTICRFLTKELKLSALLSWGVLCIPLGISLLYRQISAEGRMFSNLIMTEGLAIPVFLIFFRFLFEYALCKTKRSLCVSAVLSLLLISIRKQMLITVGLLVVVVFINCWLAGNYKSKIKKLLGSTILPLGLCAVILLGTTGLDYGYNLIFTGNASQHTGGARFIGAVAIYISDREDVSHIEDPELKELFLDIYDTCDEAGYLADPQLSGWYDRSVHFRLNCDNIQLRTLQEKAFDFAKEKCADDDLAAHKYADEIMTEFTMSILPNHIPGLSTLYLSNCVAGFVFTIAKVSRLFAWFSAVVYAVYLALLVWVTTKRKGDSAYKNLAVFAGLSLLSTVINTCVVSVGIFPQTRYMVYNMYLLYTALALMSVKLCEYLAKKYLLKKKENDSN